MSEGSRWNWLNISFLVGTLLLAIILVPIQVSHSKDLVFELLVCLAMVVAIGISVTAGYHRLFSHRTFQAGWPLRLLLLFFGAAAFENSALKWASDHRLHHRYVDTDRDPYRIETGFWYAHWVWVMEKKSPAIQSVTDLEKDPLVRWQHRHPLLIGAMAASIPIWIGLATHNLWGHIVIGVLLRIVITHHTTFLINSAAHVFGTRPYTDGNTARDNALLAPFTFGEGYHNFHHMWPGDYRNGVKWYQWDPTKWMIRGLAWFGLTRKLRRVPDTVIHRAEIHMEARRLGSKLENASSTMASTLHERLVSARLRLDNALISLQEHRDNWNMHRAEWKAAMIQHRAELQAAWEEWKAMRMLVNQVA